MFSTILKGDIDVRPINDKEMSMIALTIFVGGFDTLLNLMSFIVGFLAENPQHRRQLVDEPELLRSV